LIKYSRIERENNGGSYIMEIIETEKKQGKGPLVLVHICCGICASSVMGRLKEENYDVMGFFYNPNIHPIEEYEKRLEVTRYVSKVLGFKLIEAAYDDGQWFKLTGGYENEPEGGKRCEVCFKIRLEETCKISKEMNIPFFTTTLTVSPHKNACIINNTGKEVDIRRFLERDFKKKDGFKRAIEFSRKHDLYCQNYCGCIYGAR